MYAVFFRGMKFMELEAYAVAAFAMTFKTVVDHESKTVVLL